LILKKSQLKWKKRKRRNPLFLRFCGKSGLRSTSITPAPVESRTRNVKPPVASSPESEEEEQQEEFINLKRSVFSLLTDQIPPSTHLTEHNHHQRMKKEDLL
jgi:hypothetical protein